MKIINIFGGPGSGKSTIAHGLMYNMKKRKYRVEMAAEYAKDLVYEKSYHILKNKQMEIFEEQHRRVERYNDGTVDYVITDCPVFVGLTYTSEEYFKKYPYFEQYVADKFKEYDNLNLFLKRVVSYVPEGRVQKDIEMAKKVDDLMKYYLNKHSIEYTEIDPIDDGIQTIFRLLQFPLEAKIFY